MSTDITKKARKVAQEFAQKIAARAKNCITFKSANTWAELENKIGVKVPDTFKSQPLSWSSVSTFANYWVSTVDQRMAQDTAQREIEQLNKPKSTITLDCDTYHNATLLPEQQTVVDILWKDLFIDKKHVARYQDGVTGSGKTYVAAAIIARCIKDDFHKDPLMPMAVPYRYVICTRKTVIEPYKRVLEDFGLGKYLGTIIYVTSYSALTSSSGSIFCSEQYDAVTDEYIFKINELFAPVVLILDEAHALNNPNTKQTKLIKAFTSLRKPPIQIWLSATPWVTVNHSRQFVIAAKYQYMGAAITEETFPAFAGSICREPHMPNIEAAKRLRSALSDYITSFPKIKWPHKAINQVLVIDFETSHARSIFDRAYEIYQERKRRAGLNTNYGSFEKLVALNQFRYAAEPHHMPAICDRADQDLKNGKAVLIGTAFREPIAMAAHRFFKMGYTREDMSIVWGGKKAWKQDILLTEEQLRELFYKATRGEYVTPTERKAITETVLYNTERIMRNETSEQQSLRLKEMESLRLTGTQSMLARQQEIDNFQSGRSRICLFTLAAGGVGLSLDHATPDLLPRVGYFTPTYSGPESRQALGRGLRRTTLSDIVQYICFMLDTVEEYHVAPLFDTKLKCIAQITQDSFNIVDLDTATRVNHKYRTKEEATIDADKEESQIQDLESDNDDEDE